MNEDGSPVGGKWSFDDQNRKPYPKDKTAPNIEWPTKDATYDEACAYVAQHFPDNPGELTEEVLYPFTYEESQRWFQQFLETRFSHFGDYEDALVAEESILHHSVLSPLINTGLLSPKKVVNDILTYAESNNVAINNTEGFIRQIIGWREFIRGVYETKGREERTRNFWEFNRKIPKSFYDGTTGLLPVDATIKKVLKTGYSHHIERLMVLGNIMVLCEFDPDEVYQWFMEMYIDSYDWVMVPNVYGMSQFADGGLMSTKPYIGGSNYLRKMGNYPKGDWEATWDALFWRFMHTRRSFFESNPRLSMLVRNLDKMSEEKLDGHLSRAEKFLEEVDCA